MSPSGRSSKQRTATHETLDLFGAPAPRPAPPAEPSPKPRSEGPTEPEARALTVSALNRQVRGVLEGAFGPVSVVGEITNWKRAGSGHRYFTLRDATAQVTCVMWRDAAARLPMDPDDGMNVLVRARIGLYESRGSYQLTVSSLDTVGDEGLHQRAFEELRRRLEAEGLLDPARRRPIPRMPTTLGVVTSTSGAALRDILTVVRRRAPWTRVLVMNARVQGEGASDEVARAIRVLGSSGRVDSLIVGRGGGSKEDLWEFNREAVARAIVECPVPVISAVGHETDVTIADLVADLRAPTPSAAAEAAVVDREVIAEWVRDARARARSALRAGVQRRRQAISAGPTRLRRAVRVLTGPRRERVQTTRARLDRALRAVVERRRVGVQVLPRLARTTRSALDRRRAEVAVLAGRLDALSPLATLRRGYSVARSPEGQVLKQLDDFVPGSNFQLRVSDGRVDCRVERIAEQIAPFAPPPPSPRDEA